MLRVCSRFNTPSSPRERTEKWERSIAAWKQRVKIISHARHPTHPLNGASTVCFAVSSTASPSTVIPTLNLTSIGGCFIAQNRHIGRHLAAQLQLVDGLESHQVRLAIDHALRHASPHHRVHLLVERLARDERHAMQLTEHEPELGAILPHALLQHALSARQALGHTLSTILTTSILAFFIAAVLLALAQRASYNQLSPPGPQDPSPSKAKSSKESPPPATSAMVMLVQRSAALLRASLKQQTAPLRRVNVFSAPLARGVSASFASKARAAAPALVSPLLQKSRNVAGLFAAGSTTAVCTYCSSAAPAAASSSAARADATTSASLPKVTLYQYEPCPYCCKVKAVLDYLRIPYNVVEVNPLTKKETKPLTDYKKVPVCTINDEVVVDSSVIISRLRELVLDQDDTKGSVANGGVSFEEEEKWRKWVDEKLILLTPPNIYRTFPESLQAFDYCLTEGKFSATERYMSKYAGAVAMYFIAKKLKTKYEIQDEREALYAAIDAYMGAVGDRDFLGGSEPNMADLSVFGVVRSVAGLETFDDLMAHTTIKPWFTRMTEKVGPTTRVSSE